MTDEERQARLIAAVEVLDRENFTAKWARLDDIAAATKAAFAKETAARARSLEAFMAATAGLRKPGGE